MPVRRNQDHGSTGDGGLPLTNDEGTRIKWGRVATFIVGLLSVEFFDGVARFVTTAWNAWVIEPLEGAATWVDRLVDGLLSTPSEILTISFGGTIRFFQQHELVAMGLAVLVVLTIAYATSRVIPRG